MNLITLTSAFFLFLFTFIVIHSVIRITKPASITKNNNVVMWKALLYSTSISFVFTLLTTLIQIKVDEQKKKN